MKFGDKTGKESSRPNWEKMDSFSTDLIKTQEIKTITGRVPKKIFLFHPDIIPGDADKAIKYYQSKWSGFGYL